ncbi:MAG TPA: hypothetical protein VEK07_03550 [Polyangiaceae bacterium]|nr:hypothetical protein [Polyangiaceae bacterium]
MAPSAPRRLSLARSLLPFLVVSLVAALGAETLSRDPRYLMAPLAVALLLSAPRIVGRWRMRKLLMSGDVERVIGTWEGTLQRAAHRGTMAPLLKATAYAAYGWIEPARRALDRAVRGPAWDAAVEQRLFIETLLDTFEGDRDAAVRKASTLEHLPMPNAGPFTRRRIALLRQGLAALARAFAHSSRGGDARLLAKAAAASPLVHWAMRYAAAVLAIDHGRTRDVPLLLAGAPSWPRESAFQAFHDELLSRVAEEAVAPST